MTVKMFDAAYPPGEASEVADYQVCAGYIGGDTPHVWTRAEWERFSRMHKLPIFTRSDPGSANAAGDAFAALRQLHAIGASAGIPFALDFETQVNAGYVDAFYDVVRWAGFLLWVYGSASTVFGNPACNGYWSPIMQAGGHSCTTTTTFAPPSTRKASAGTRPWSNRGRKRSGSGSRTRRPRREYRGKAATAPVVIAVGLRM